MSGSDKQYLGEIYRASERSISLTPAFAKSHMRPEHGTKKAFVADSQAFHGVFIRQVYCLEEPGDTGRGRPALIWGSGRRKTAAQRRQATTLPLTPPLP